MRRVAIVQARTGSTRLPGKVLMDLAGRPMLAQQLRRIRRCSRIDEIVVATTDSPADDAVVELARTEGVGWSRGSEHDVLARYVGAAREARADVIIRLTADCPLLDPQKTDLVVQSLEERRAECDYASNVVRRTFPRGLDTEALYADTLDRLARLAQSPAAREHVTLFLLQERPNLFAVHSVTDAADNSDLRWTVDTQRDLDLVRRLYANLGLDEAAVPYEAIVAHVRSTPGLASLNVDAAQGA